MNRMNYFLLILLIFIFSTCGKSQKKDSKIIKIDIEKRDQLSLLDIFEKVEVISLETKDSTLIREVEKIVTYDNKLFVHDYRMSRIIVFDMNGKLIFSIDNKGVGPNQYLDISDFDIIEQKIYLLSASNGALYKYNLKGEFLEKMKLPKMDRSYTSFQYINNDTIALWTYDFNNRLKLYSISKDHIFKEAFPENDNIFNQFSTPVFPFKNHIAKSFDNSVYEISSNCEIKLAYKWDFGTLNNVDEMFKDAPIFNSPGNSVFDYVKKIQSSQVVNYIFGLNGMNSRYIYTQITRKNTQVNLFYDKKTKNDFVFEETIEKAHFYPVFWAEDYVIGIIPKNENIGINDIIPDKILDVKNKNIKRKITEYDNPILIKYYFKK